MTRQPARRIPPAPDRPGARPARPSRTSLIARSCLTLLLCAACGASEPAAVEVAGIGYTGTELGALSEAQRERLATLTAFGAAVARGELDRLARPYVERRTRSRLLRQLAHEVALRRAGTTDAELRERYLRRPEYELVVRHIIFISERGRSAEQRDAARRNAERALARVRAGENFAELAAELSEEPGAAERGGRLAPGRRGTWVPEFWEAAVALEPGEVSDVVRTEYGFHVIELEEKRVLPFEEVRAQVLPRLVDDPGALH
ncbi:MAG: peptidylprolyl isomerase, partial [Gemmatimonadota bacterium]